MTLSTALRLGRVSNLPTVWTNVLAGVALAGAHPHPVVLGGLLAALSLFYVAGMYLNDAFDRAIDARERPTRPIPAGEVEAGTVVAAALAMFAVGMAALVWIGQVTPAPAWGAPVAGAVLAAAILYYDWNHKGNPWSPVVMALCRLLVYVTAALAVAPALPPAVAAGGLGLFCYLVGLTHLAKAEASGRIGAAWPLALMGVPMAYGAWLAGDRFVALAPLLAFAGWTIWTLWRLRAGRLAVPGTVAALLAGICLYDAMLILAHGRPGLALAAAVAFPLTLALQRRVPGT